MKLTNTLGQHAVQSTTTAKKMRLSDNATSRVFQLFTKNVYSDAIGTVVREIASNCFDSHVEAKVNSPVVIRKTHDTETDTYSISFIDYGVGMSPERVENIYGVYFESTKNQSNEEIGGFGIGGKTPLAYMRSTGEGEGDYDNGFFVITRYNGIEYTYSIVEGKESPEIHLWNQEATTERNGTEIRVPMLSGDIQDFESALRTQLFYFDNIVFEGWSDRIQNEYQIIRGKTFLYRGDNLDNNMHVCLGKVYYPINYRTMGLQSYDYQIPIAINVQIGAINVTVSREQLDYSQETITYLKKRLNEAKDELRSLLEKQYSNITSLEDYFKSKNNFGILYLTDDMSLNIRRLADSKKLDYSKYEFSGLSTPDDRELFKLFFNTTCYGKRELKGYSRNDFEQLTRSYDGLTKVKNVYFSDGEYSCKRIKQAYLRGQHGRFYVVKKKELAMEKYTVCDLFNAHFDDDEAYLKSATYKDVLKMQEAYFAIVREHGVDYSAVEVPDDFTVDYGKPKISQEIKNTTIPMKLHGSYGKTRIKIQSLIDFKGTIYYSDSDGESKLGQAHSLFELLYTDKYIAESYSTYHNTFGKAKSVAFISLAKNNMKYIKYLKNAYTVERFYHKHVARKEEEIKKQYRTSNFAERYHDIESFYLTPLFADVSPKWGKKIEDVKTFVSTLKVPDRYSRRSDISHFKMFLSKYINFDKLTYTAEEKAIIKTLDALKEIEAKNETLLKYFELPYRSYTVSKETDNEIVVPILKKAMSL